MKGSSRIRNDSIKEAPVAEGGLGWTGCATAPRLPLAMRQLTQFDEEALASRFRDFMQAEGIEATVSPSAEGRFALWVHDDAHLGDARDLLARFERDPDDPEIRARLEEVWRARRDRALGEAEAMRRFAELHRAHQLAVQLRRAGPVTHFVVFALLGFALMAAFFTDGDPERVYVHLEATREALRGLEFHRLLTPVFVVSGLPHPLAVLEVMLGVFWIRTLGGPVERLDGSLSLAVALILGAAISTGLELALYGTSVGGPMGAAASLFGYLWLRGRLDSTLVIRLRGDVAFWMVAWFLIGVAGPGGGSGLPRLGVGLLVGFAWAVLRTRRRHGALR